MKIKPYWEKYENWECYKNGMNENRLNEDNIRKSYETLISDNLLELMTETAVKYEVSTRVNFTNRMFNPVSWLGQACCNYLHNSTSRETCQAWLCMTKEQQTRANNIAKSVIKKWRGEYEDIQ